MLVLTFRPFRSSPSSPADTDSSDDSSDSDSDEENGTTKTPAADVDDDDDEEGGPNPTSANQLRTKNELLEPDIKITIPTIEEVGSEEALEKVGEVMSILNGSGNGVVVVKGLPMRAETKASERALDSETLLVFEDRKVLGYVSTLYSLFLL